MSSNICAWTVISQEPRTPQGVLTDEFVQRFDRYVDWEQLSIHYFFTLIMLRTYAHRVNWNFILQRQKLSENVLIEMSPYFDDYSCWEIISKHQNLSETYIERYKDKLDWELLFDNQRLTGEFLRKHKDYMKFIYFNVTDNEMVVTPIKSGTSSILPYFCYIYITCLLLTNLKVYRVIM